MNRKFKLYLASPPGPHQTAGHTPSVMAYRIGQDFHLYRISQAFQPVGLMDIDCSGFTGGGPHRLLTDEVVEECSRGFSGVVMEVTGPASRDLEAFFGMLGQALRERGLSLYIPLKFARASECAALLIPAFCVTGTLESRLRTVVDKNPERRLFLVIDCAAAEFPLPFSGSGRPIKREELAAIKSRYPNASRYSPELCANTLTYFSGGRRRLILWDDKRSVRDKLKLGARLGFAGAFLYRPQVEEFLSALDITE